MGPGAILLFLLANLFSPHSHSPTLHRLVVNDNDRDHSKARHQTDKLRPSPQPSIWAQGKRESGPRALRRQRPTYRVSSPLQPRPLRGTNHPTSLSVCGPFSPPPGPGTHSISPSLGTARPDLFVATRMTHSLLRPYRAPPQCSPGDPPPAARLSPRPHSLCSPAPTFPLWFSLVFDPSKPFDPKKRGMRAGGLPGSWRLPGSKTAGDWAELALSSGPTWSAVHSRRS